MIEFLKRLFGHQGSSATAKERLRLVLMTDHLELAPEMIETMKRELVDVISRHVEVDRDRIEVNFERQDRTLALLANIPILSVNRPNGKVVPAAAPERPKAETSKKSAAVSNGETKPPRKRRRRKKSQTTASQPA
ncbi:MAG: cell division topological specificity factor MinE [Candidatus Eremiobacteraeota bacterium]|nr:cell division topological specificity factor MinE [Candidatus Eremiobacteraeota bacterium]